MSKKLSLVLTIILILTSLQESYSEVVNFKGKKYVDVGTYNKLVDENNYQYQLLIESRDKLRLAEENLQSAIKIKCHKTEFKNKIIIGSVCVTVGLVLGFGLGFGLGFKK